MTNRRKCLALFLALLMGCSNNNYNSGDRVLVAKDPYDLGIGDPNRFDVVVFKYPDAPIERGIPKNYIKRLMGLPGELLAIFFGQIFFFLPEPGEPPLYDDVDNPLVDAKNLWKKDPYMHVDDEKSQKLFLQPGKFRIIRKPPEVMLDMRRIVYDNDFQAKDLETALPPRWQPEGAGWTAKGTEFENPGTKKGVDWLHYQNITRSPDGSVTGRKKELITDFMDYNAALRDTRDPPFFVPEMLGGNWVGDLMVEFQLDVTKAEGELWVELSRGIFRYQARFDLATGKCSLYRLDQDKSAKILMSRDKLSTVDTHIKSPGTYQVRLANFDARLTLWIDKDLPFGEGMEFDPPEIPSKSDGKLDEKELQKLKRRGPYENDLEPASIGSVGAQVRISHLRLWRNTYYTLHGPSADAGDRFSLSDPATWEPLRNLGYKTMYVQPGHFLCLGDNSPQSSDSRDWGVVPRRLMLGRALLVYYPLNRAGPIR